MLNNGYILNSDNSVLTMGSTLLGSLYPWVIKLFEGVEKQGQFFGQGHEWQPPVGKTVVCAKMPPNGDYLDEAALC